MNYFKLYVNILFSISAIVSSAQTENKNSLGKFSIGITFGSNYSYRTLNFSSYNKPIANERNDNEIGRLGFTTGIELKNRIFKKILFSYGLQYSNFGYSTRFKTLNFVSPNPGYPIRSKTEFLYESIGIPLSIQYHFSNSKFRPYIKAGIQGDWIFQKTVTTVIGYEDHTANSKDKATLGYEPLQIALLAGFGIEYPLSKKISILGEPLFRQNITSLNADLTAKEKPYSIGLVLKICYSFK
jgi:hypothetical protein